MVNIASKEIHRDDSPMFTGTHGGADGASVLYSKDAMFKQLGVSAGIGQYVENETKSTGGVVTASTRDTVTADGVTWDNGDTYNIYITETKNQTISTVWTDVSRGWKAEPGKLTRDGWRKEDVDIDDHGKIDIFGPGQPEKG